MKRFLSLALILLLLLSCTACVGRAAPPVEDPVPAPDPQEVAAAQPANPLPEEEPEEEPEEPEEPYVRVIDPAKPMVALTYDDGPDGTWSDAILDVLEEHHALATFFEVGRNVLACPEPVRRMAAMGCEVASHSNAHRDLSKLKKKTLLRDLDAADEAFAAAGVEAPTLVRPPYGAVNKTVKSATGRAMITWTVDTEDWQSRDAQAVIGYVQSIGDLDGEIILMHSIYESTAEATRVLVPWLQEQGYQLVTVTELMAYYYGELPQPDHFYGYTYFTTHGRTDTPVPLPGEEVPGAGLPAPEDGEGAPAEAADGGEDPADMTGASPEEAAGEEENWEPVRVAEPGPARVPASPVPNPALFNP